MKEEQRINVFNLKLINQVRSQIPCAPYITYIQDDIAIYDFDREMVNLPIGLAQDLIVDRIIGNIRVSRTRKGYATIKNKRHHTVTPEIFERKWGIGLEE